MQTSLPRCREDIARVPRLFVYGTLRREGGANRIMGRSRLVGRARLKGFTLSVQGIPFIYPTPDRPEPGLVGEVYELEGATRLQDIDRYEGSCYFRGEIAPVLIDLDGANTRALDRPYAVGEVVPAWAYIALPDVALGLREDEKAGTAEVAEDFIESDRGARRWSYRYR